MRLMRSPRCPIPLDPTAWTLHGVLLSLNVCHQLSCALPADNLERLHGNVRQVATDVCPMCATVERLVHVPR